MKSTEKLTKKAQRKRLNDESEVDSIDESLICACGSFIEMREIYRARIGAEHSATQATMETKETMDTIGETTIP